MEKSSCEEMKHSSHRPKQRFWLLAERKTRNLTKSGGQGLPRCILRGKESFLRGKEELWEEDGTFQPSPNPSVWPQTSHQLHLNLTAKALGCFNSSSQPTQHPQSVKGGRNLHPRHNHTASPRGTSPQGNSPRLGRRSDSSVFKHLHEGLKEAAGRSHAPLREYLTGNDPWSNK